MILSILPNQSYIARPNFSDAIFKQNFRKIGVNARQISQAIPTKKNVVGFEVIGLIHQISPTVEDAKSVDIDDIIARKYRKNFVLPVAIR